MIRGSPRLMNTENSVFPGGSSITALSPSSSGMPSGFVTVNDDFLEVQKKERRRKALKLKLELIEGEIEHENY